MLGLLMMAGLGFAATAIIDHMDNQSADGAHPQDEDEATSHTTVHDDQAAHGSLLDDPDTQASPDIHATSAAHNVQDHDVQDTQANGHGGHHGATHHHSTKGHHQPEHHQAAHHQTAHHQTGHNTSGQSQTTHHPHSQTTAAHDTQAQNAHKGTSSDKMFGGDGNDTLHGSNHGDLIEGNAGDDKLFGHGGNDTLISFDAGHDTLIGGAGNDTLHGYLVQKQPDGVSYVVEDHQADHLHGGLGKDTLFLGSDDVGTGGHDADSFHVSWDVEHGHPAQITDYNPKLDKIYVDFTSNHADAGMTDIKAQEHTITTEPMKDGEGTAILINGQEIAHVLGATHLSASDIGLIQA